MRRRRSYLSLLESTAYQASNVWTRGIAGRGRGRVEGGVRGGLLENRRRDGAFPRGVEETDRGVRPIETEDRSAGGIHPEGVPASAPDVPGSLQIPARIERSKVIEGKMLVHGSRAIF